MKTFFNCIFLTGGAVLMIYAARTGFEKQARVDCLNASRICEGFRDVHKGKCAECRLADYCTQKNII